MKIVICLGAPLVAPKNIGDLPTPSSHLQDRLEETVRQYKKNDIVIVTGAKCQKFSYSEAQIMSNYLQTHGIFPIMEERALNTIQNGSYTKFLVDKLTSERNGIATETPIMVITSDFHMVRAVLIFTHYFGAKQLVFKPVKSSILNSLNKKEPNHILRLLDNFPPPVIPPDRTLLEEVVAGYEKGVTDYIERTGDTDEVEETTGNTALHWACSCGFGEICEILLKANPSLLNKVNKQNLTPLHYAIISGRIEAVWVLLSYGADTTISGSNHRWISRGGTCNAGETLISLRTKLHIVVYTVLVLMLAKFNKEPSTVWIRHGETNQNLALQSGESIEGIFDATLTDKGVKHSEMINYYILKYKLLEEYDVFVSPLSRTMETCRLLIKNLDITPRVDERIMERLNHTSCIGKTRELLQEVYDWDFSTVENEWWYLPTLNHSDSVVATTEGFDKLCTRVDDFRKDIIGNNKNILVVTHGGVIHYLFNRELIARNCDAFIVN